MSAAPKKLAKHVGDPAAADGLFGVMVIAHLRTLLGRAPFPATPKCGCGSTRDAETGLCLEGCDAFRKPHVKARQVESRQRRREQEAGRPTVSRKAASDGAARVSPTINHHTWQWGARRRGAPTS